MINGKVCQTLTFTPSSNCVICGVKPSKINKLNAKKIEKVKNFQLGMSTLHAWLHGVHFTFSLSFTFSQMVSQK